MGYTKQKYKILLTGGGTGGSVAPLLVIDNVFRANPLTVDKFFAILKLINPTMFLPQFFTGNDHG
ncbi:hypothetical protein KKC83_04110 [Patescibacteria group bacterium]|nr:hypothetical protein [Candidatus Falkowbacteria bacterium]MBU3905908.1 hypothetical protein [Patescibacteria group bacterium]MBU4014726.1 hypothetical protein [Patescibacteria group bacterium]MBU4026699.1 hypothetical protein [Patescibacteria group bacterium]MBU4072972.1 hypothetical protein [Patescibacteria group bacterium]